MFKDTANCNTVIIQKSKKQKARPFRTSDFIGPLAVTDLSQFVPGSIIYIVNFVCSLFSQPIP